MKIIHFKNLFLSLFYRKWWFGIDFGRYNGKGCITGGMVSMGYRVRKNVVFFTELDRDFFINLRFGLNIQEGKEVPGLYFTIPLHTKRGKLKK